MQIEQSLSAFLFTWTLFCNSLLLACIWHDTRACHPRPTPAMQGTELHLHSLESWLFESVTTRNGRDAGTTCKSLESTTGWMTALKIN